MNRPDKETDALSRRGVLMAGLAAAGGSVVAAKSANGQTSPATGQHSTSPGYDPASPHENAHGAMMTVGQVDNAANGFDGGRTGWTVGT